jgi:hypothetical protein
MRAIITPDDLKRGDLAEPGWHPAEFNNYDEKPASTDKSTNCIFMFRIIDGPNKGIQPRTQFNEKALGYGKNLWKTLKLPNTPNGGYEVSTELFKAKLGSKLKIYIKRGKNPDTGNEFNEVADFMPLEAT